MPPKLLLEQLLSLLNFSADIFWWVPYLSHKHDILANAVCPATRQTTLKSAHISLATVPDSRLGSYPSRSDSVTTTTEPSSNVTRSCEAAAASDAFTIRVALGAQVTTLFTKRW